MQNERERRNRALRPYLSALVDGEMEPLEAIALQRHVRQHPDLEREVSDIEQLKLSLHMAGRREEAPPGLETRLKAHLAEAMAAKREEAPLAGRFWGWTGIVAVGAIALTLAVMATRGDESTAEVNATATTAGVFNVDTHLAERLGIRPGRAQALDGRAVISALIDTHRGDLPEQAVHMLRRQKVIEGWERVPAGFVEPHGKRTQLVLASTMSCTERPGATLVILPARRIDLPPHVDNALETSGVFSERLDGVEVRYSRSGDKLFVVIHGDELASELDPI
jgi:hypothetical protein